MIRVKPVFSLLIKGELKILLNGISKRFNSEVIALGFKNDLNEKTEIPKAQIELKIRLSKKSDTTHFVDDNYNLGLVEENIKNLYVATTQDDLPCFRLWLMDSSQNEKIKRFFTGNFPTLNSNEALIESAFTLPAYRGKRIMPEVTTRLLKKETSIGIQYAICFININNTPSLRAYKRCGFKPYTLRQEKWFLFKKRVSFVDIPNDMLEKYHSLTS